MGRLRHSQAACLFRILHLMTLFPGRSLCALVYKVLLSVRSPLLSCQGKHFVLVSYKCDFFPPFDKTTPCQTHFPSHFPFFFFAQPQLLFHTAHGGLCVNISQLQVENNEEKDKGLQLKIVKDGFSDATEMTSWQSQLVGTEKGHVTQHHT